MVNATWKKIASQVKLILFIYLMGVEHHIFDSTIERLNKALPDIDESFNHPI